MNSSTLSPERQNEPQSRQLQWKAPLAKRVQEQHCQIKTPWAPQAHAFGGGGLSCPSPGLHSCVAACPNNLSLTPSPKRLQSGGGDRVLFHWLVREYNSDFSLALFQPHPAVDEAKKGQGGRQSPLLAYNGKERCLPSCQKKC